MRKRNGDDTVLHHGPRGGRQLHLIVPIGAQSEGDVGVNGGAVFAHRNGVGGVQFKLDSARRQVNSARLPITKSFLFGSRQDD